MVESTSPERKDQWAQRANQILSGIVACAVLGVGGVMAYQNRETLKMPDRNSAWASFWTKKMSDNSGFPKFEAPEYKWAVDYDKMASDRSTLFGPGTQFDPAPFSGGTGSSSPSSHRRR